MPKEYVEEDISADIRDALGNNLDALEEVEIVSETMYNELPKTAREKLGCQPHQKNVLVHSTLRHLERSITNDEANRMYEILYTRINQGTAGYV